MVPSPSSTGTLGFYWYGNQNTGMETHNIFMFMVCSFMFYILKYVIWSLCEHILFVRYEQIDGGNILIVNIDSLCMHACVFITPRAHARRG